MDGLITEGVQTRDYEKICEGIMGEYQGTNTLQYIFDQETLDEEVGDGTQAAVLVNPGALQLNATQAQLALWSALTKEFVAQTDHIIKCKNKMIAGMDKTLQGEVKGEGKLATLTVRVILARLKVNFQRLDPAGEKRLTDQLKEKIKEDQSFAEEAAKTQETFRRKSVRNPGEKIMNREKSRESV